ncbi:MAG: carbohydrate kinase family protein [Acidobacteriota bacterium]|nr:carbohydrate kinase family protein [Acidobacteriota bacterium]
MMPGLTVVCGNVVLDILARPVENPLRWGTSTLIEEVEQHLGGNAGTTSYTLATLGAPVQLIGLVGRDSAAGALISILEEAGVNTRLLQFTKAPTSTAISLVNEAGERALLYHLGASAEDFTEPLELPAEAAHFHLAAVYRMRYLRSAAPRILKSARDAGLTTSVDTQWDHEGEWLRVLAPSLPFTDFLFLNEEEARLLSGREDPADAARAMHAMGARHVIVKLGERGCLVDGREIVPGFRVQAVDTTGAGDCFVGGFLAALHRGASRAEAARFANAVAAMAVQKLGAVRGVVSYEETLIWMAAQSAIIPRI